MYIGVVLFHVLACMALILIVLLQTGKGAEMGAAFGGASQTLFGGSGGTTFLGRLTTGAAIAFMITCLGLTYLSTGPQTKSVMEDVPVATTEAPMLPDAKPIQPAPEQTAPQTTPKPEASAVPVSPDKPAPQAQETTKAQQPAKEETKTPPPKAQEKRPEKPAAGAKKQ
jgi:preprotein translocase subunit SecG